MWFFGPQCACAAVCTFLLLLFFPFSDIDSIHSMVFFCFIFGRHKFYAYMSIEHIHMNVNIFGDKEFKPCWNIPSKKPRRIHISTVKNQALLLGISGAHKIDCLGRCSCVEYNRMQTATTATTTIVSAAAASQTTSYIDTARKKAANISLIDSRLVWSIDSFFYVVSLIFFSAFISPPLFTSTLCCISCTFFNDIHFFVLAEINKKDALQEKVLTVSA